MHVLCLYLEQAMFPHFNIFPPWGALACSQMLKFPEQNFQISIFSKLFLSICCLRHRTVECTKCTNILLRYFFCNTATKFWKSTNWLLNIFDGIWRPNSNSDILSYKIQICHESWKSSDSLNFTSRLE